MGFLTPGWTLGAPIEEVILDDEEKSTTYAETGDTGLLLGTVKLPAPKTQYGVGCLTLVSAEVKTMVVPLDWFKQEFMVGRQR